MHNCPRGRVALVILATGSAPAVLGRTLKWLRHQWPRRPVAGVGDEGAGAHEMAAREGGAIFLTRPVQPEELSAVLSHALKGARQAEEVREYPG